MAALELIQNNGDVHDDVKVTVKQFNVAIRGG